MPDLNVTEGKKKNQRKCGESGHGIRHDHYQAAIHAVNKGAGKGSQKNLWQDGNQSGCGKHGGGSGLLGDIPNQSKLNQSAAKEGDDLSYPQRDKTPLPV
jgi:hypothetical protein